MVDQDLVYSRGSHTKPVTMAFCTERLVDRDPRSSQVADVEKARVLGGPPAIREPEDTDSRIWRYMDFTKYVSLLQHRGVFFGRADRLGDPFEGSISRGTKDAERRWLKEHG